MKNRIGLSIIAIIAAMTAVGFIWLKSQSSESELFKAVKHGDINLLRKRLENGSLDVNRRYLAKDPQKGGETLLHMACEHAQLEVVRLLIQSGADPNVQDNYGRTPIMVLLSETDRSEVRLQCLDILLEAKADLSLQDRYSGDILYHAVTIGEIGYVRRLLRRGAPLNQTSPKNRWTPLHMACSRENSPRHIEIIQILLKAGADASIKDKDGNTPLDVALLKKNMAAVEMLRSSQK